MTTALQAVAERDTVAAVGSRLERRVRCRSFPAASPMGVTPLANPPGRKGRWSTSHRPERCAVNLGGRIVLRHAEFEAPNV
jgi:hypothetical protein